MDEIQQIQTNINKNREVLVDLKHNRQFIESLTPEEFLSQQGEERL